MNDLSKQSNINQESEIRKPNEQMNSRMDKLSNDIKNSHKPALTTINHNNNNNNTIANNTIFNMNVFLNETYVNAINLKQFVKNLKCEICDTRLLIDIIWKVLAV